MSKKTVVLLLVAIFVALPIIGFVCGWFGEAVEVAQEEFGPRAALEKYEWFIEQASAIEKMDQDIKLFENRAAGIDEQYASYGDRLTWDLATRAQYNQAKQTARDDLVAIISQRNNLVREYNAASEKFNWAPFETRLDKPRESFQEYVVQ